MKNKSIDKIFKAKRSFHKAASKEPVEIKIRKLIELQKIYISVLKSTGRDCKGKKVWNMR